MSDYKPKKKPKREWCDGGGKIIDLLPGSKAREHLIEPSKTKKKYVRCSVCDQRFEVWNDVDWFTYDDVVQRVPKHKAY